MNHLISTRRPRPWALAAVSAAVFLGLAVPLALALVPNQALFGSHFTTGPAFAYRTEDFPGLVRTPHPFATDGGRTLAGYVYRQTSVAEPRALVVFAHGFGGGGHRGYLPVVAALAARGYAVFAYDATGNDESPGSGIGSLAQGPRDLVAALAEVRAERLAGGRPVFLLGHSWGGFSVLASLPRTGEDVRAAVTAAAFNEAPAMAAGAAELVLGAPGGLVAPWLGLLDHWREGGDAGATAAAGLAASRPPVLLLQSDDDRTVPFTKNLAAWKSAFGSRPGTEFWTLHGRGHDVFGPLAAGRSGPGVADPAVIDRITAFFGAHQGPSRAAAGRGILGS